MTFQPIKTKKIYEEIMEQIRQMIAQGDLKPGDKLPSERELADTLGVSRTSVREALTALGALGIIDVKSGEGTFIRRSNDSETFEPLGLLLAIERNPEVQLMEVGGYWKLSRRLWPPKEQPRRTWRKSRRLWR